MNSPMRLPRDKVLGTRRSGRATVFGDISAINDRLTGILHSIDWAQLELSAVQSEPSDHRQAVSGRLTTMGVGVLRTTTQRNGSTFDELISM